MGLILLADFHHVFLDWIEIAKIAGFAGQVDDWDVLTVLDHVGAARQNSRLNSKLGSREPGNTDSDDFFVEYD